MPRLLPLMLLLLACFVPPASARLTGPSDGIRQPSDVRDLAAIRESGELRVLINQSRHSSAEVRGELLGLEYVRLVAFVRFLNQQPGTHGQIRLKLLPLAKDQLLGALQRGEGDLLAPGELLGSKTPAPLARSRPVELKVPLVLVTAQGSRRYYAFEQLSGRSVALAPGSAAGAEFARLNAQLVAAGKQPVVVEWVDPALAVEDVLELVAAGIYPATVVEQSIAERWAKVFSKLRIERELVLGSPRDSHWYVRHEAAALLAAANRFLTDYRPPSDRDAALVRVYRRLHKAHYPLDRVVRQRLEKVRPILQRHAQTLELDWLALAALAYKESTLNPAARGAGGATGLMQVTPATARSMGVGNIDNLDSNVLAAARYLANLRRNFFDSPRISERERLAFMLASYNMGPQRIEGLRAEATRRGLDPDRWFFQVERLALEQYGSAVPNYVASVTKYFLAFDRERYLLESGASR